MKLKINTGKLQEMLSRAIKGASNNKMLPITSLIAIQVNNGQLTLTTTDATNYLYIKETLEGEHDDFYIVVAVDTLSKLIARMTSEYVTLEVKENKLEVVGNGKYSIEIPLDENGEFITYPDPIKSVDLSTETSKINLSTIKSIVATCKSALAVTMEVPCYTGYYVGDSVVATDTYKICELDTKLFNTPELISPEMMDLLDSMVDEQIKCYISDETIVFTSNSCNIYGKVLEGIEDYAIDAITGLLGEEFDSMCKIPKNELLAVLDRLSLFVGVYDKNGVYLTFTDKGLTISSKGSSGTELIEYNESEGFKEFTCCIDIEMFQSQIKSQSTDMLELWYGKDNAIKLVNDSSTCIVALLEDDRITE